MTAETKPRSALSRLGAALARGAQWRLLSLWTLGLLLPSAVVALPAWQVLAGLLDHAPRAAELARAFDPLSFQDMAAGLNRSGAAMTGSSLLAALLALLLSPLLAGVTLTAARTEQSPGFGALLHGALAWYWRMFRLLLVSLLPLSLAGGLAALLVRLAQKRAAHAILESQGTWTTRLLLVAALLLFLSVHATVEAGRAQFAADSRRHSAWLAWFRGIQLTCRRPLAVLGLYLAPTLLSLLLAAALLLVRLRLVQSSAGAVALAFVLTQLTAAALGWGRASRLFALISLAR